MNQEKLNRIIADPTILNRPDIKNYLKQVPQNIQQVYYQAILSMVLIRSLNQAPIEDQLQLTLSRF